MNSPLSQCRCLFFAVAGLHELGYRDVRAMPLLRNGAWSLAIADGTVFSARNGAVIESTMVGSAAIFRSHEFGLPDVGVEPMRLATRLAERFSGLWARVSADSTAYSAWLESLIAHMAVHPSALPSVFPDGDDGQVWIHYLSDDLGTHLRNGRRFQRPPSGRFGSEMPGEIAIAQPRPEDAPDLIWTTMDSSHTALDDWWEQYRPRESD